MFAIYGKLIKRKNGGYMTKEKKLRNIIVGILVIVLIFVAYYAFTKIGRGEAITYQEFVTKLEAGEITHVYGVGGTFRVRKVDSKISEERFKNSSYADYTFTVAVSDEVSNIKEMLYKYNNYQYQIPDLDADGNVQYETDGVTVKMKTLVPAQQVVYNTEPAQESLLSRLLPYLSLIFIAILAFFIEPNSS